MTLASSISDWVLSTPLSEALQETPNFVQVNQVLHYFAIALLLSATLVVDLRVLGVLRVARPMEAVIRRFAPSIWIGLAVLVATGVLMLLVETRGIGTGQFQLKILALLLATGLTGLVQQRMQDHGADWDGRPSGAPAAVKVMAATSLGLWLAIVCLGRWIAYA